VTQSLSADPNHEIMDSGWGKNVHIFEQDSKSGALTVNCAVIVVVAVVVLFNNIREEVCLYFEGNSTHCSVLTIPNNAKFQF